MCCQREQAVHFTTIESVEQVDLVFEGKLGAERFAGRMVRVLIDAFYVYLRSVSLEFAANHFDVRIQWIVPLEGIGGRMHTHKALARFYPIQKSLLIRQRQVAGG